MTKEKREKISDILTIVIMCLILATGGIFAIYQKVTPSDSEIIMNDIVKSGQAYEITFLDGDKEYNSIIQLDHENKIIKCLYFDKNTNNEETLMKFYIDAINEKYYWFSDVNINDKNIYELYANTDILSMYENDKLLISNTVDDDYKSGLSSSFSYSRILFDNNDLSMILISLDRIFNNAGIDVNIYDSAIGKAKITNYDKEQGIIEFTSEYKDTKFIIICKETEELIINTKEIEETVSVSAE